MKKKSNWFMKFLFGRSYKPQKAEFWKKFWKEKWRETLFALAITSAVVVGYFALLWFPASLLVSGNKEPKYFFDEVIVTQVGTLTNSVTTNKAITFKSRYPIFKNGIQTQSSIEEMTRVYKSGIDFLYEAAKKPMSEYDETLVGLRGLNEFHDSDLYAEDWIKVNVKTWKTRSISLPESIDIVTTPINNVKTNFHLIKFNDCPVFETDDAYNGTDWFDANMWVILYALITWFIILLISVWFEENYRKLTNK
jgi:hypothetical protein